MERVDEDQHSQQADHYGYGCVVVNPFAQNQISEQHDKNGVAAEKYGYDGSRGIDHAQLEQNHAYHNADESRQGQERPVFSVEFGLFPLCFPNSEGEKNNPSDQESQKCELNGIETSRAEFQSNFHSAEKESCQGDVKKCFFQFEIFSYVYVINNDGKMIKWSNKVVIKS
jgi:hypothetical protein